MEAINMPIHLVIKAPNQKIEDQVVHCDLDWTVQRVKAYLSEEYPNNPKIEEQKLIYCGRLLHNHLKLKDVLRYEDGQTHTLHLVCAPKDPFPYGTTSQQGVQESTSTTNSSSSSSSSSQTSFSNTQYAFTQPSSSTNEVHSPELHQRFTTQQIPQSFQFLQVTPPVAFSLSPEMIAQQMAAMQQMYAQYLAQYMQYAQSTGVPHLIQTTIPQTPPPPQPPHHPPPPPPVPEEGNNNNGANQGAPAPPRPVNENIRMNAQGGPLLDDDDDDVGNRDWLDWFYVLSRTLVLFTIVYFYSSPGRFMIVTGITILAYLYQGGWLGVRRPDDQARNQELRQNHRNENAQLPNQNVDQQQPMEQVAENAHEMENLMDGDLQHYREQREEEENRGSPFLTAWTFISSFFSSLIPEQPAPVNIN